MTVSLLFGCGLAVTALLSLLVVAYLQAPLRKLLAELCGNQERAQFWAVFANVTVALVPVIFAMWYSPSTGPSSSALLEVAAQLKWGLIGLVVSVLILGKVIASFIPRGPAVTPAPLQDQGGQR